jgi:hypothetical protein
LALRLSACEFGSAGAGLHFVMRSERMADAMREMGFEGVILRVVWIRKWALCLF